MEEIEVPLEQVHETLHEKAHESGGGWFSQVALSSALLAVCAAVASLLAGHHSNEAMIEQLHSSDQWNFFQAKGIKSSVLETRLALLEGMGKKAPEKDREKFAEYKKEQEEISREAKEAEHESKHHLGIHQIMARAVTMFQVAIAISAISVLMRRRKFWFVSLAFGLAGLGFLFYGLTV